MFASREIQDTVFREKYVEIVNAVDMLAAAVNANHDRIWYDHEQNIRDSVEFLDKLYQIYGGAFKFNGSEIVPITERFYETSPLEPFDFPEFRYAISEQESGGLIIGFTPEDQKHRPVHLYFRWMPSYSPPNERYLVVSGVSQYSVTATVNLWVSIGQWISMIVTFIINAWLIMLIARLGRIKEEE
jgi:hypothetical protein